MQRHVQMIRLCINFITLILASMYRLFTSAVFSLLIVCPTSAQILFSNGALFHVSTGAIVITNGGTEIANSSTFTNEGTFTVTRNSTLPATGNFTINSSSTVTSNGTLRVQQDWINNATFNSGTGEVELFGDLQQFITSTNGTVTTFNNLTLTGTGVGNNRKKTLSLVNARTGTNGILSIGNRELETQTQSFFVLNTALTSVTNITTPGSEGFVSSLAPGTFSRLTANAGAYLFPTGSSLGTLRYRPVDIVPSAGANNEYTARLNNNDPNVDGFNRADNDGTQCVLNNLYYHSILRPTGSTSSDIRLYYIPASDGSWANMGHWRTTNNIWNDMSAMALGVSGVFNTVTRPTWNFTNPGDPYVLTNVRPEQPVISCPSICENSTGNVFTLTGTASNYQWTVPANGSITSGQGTSTISTNWTNGSGYVYVYAVGVNGCNSLPDSCLPAVFQNPLADFTYMANGEYGDNYSFTDQSTGTTSWHWDFGDGNSSTAQNPTYQYSAAGTYTVILTASNGPCTDTMMIVVNAEEGIFIPNVFSPNGDLANDVFDIRSSGLTEYGLQIYNRWGQLMFDSEDPTEKWDGKNLSGNVCPDGTYYFILKAISNSRDFSTTGTVTIMGAKQ